MRFIVDANELRGNPQLISRAPHAALQHIVHAQFTSDIRNALICSLEHHGRGPGDHAQPLGIQPAQLRNHFLSQPLAKVLLIRIGTEVLEWQDDEQHLFLRCTRRFLGDADGDGEPVASFGNGGDVIGPVRVGAEHLTKHRDGPGQASLFDNGILPGRFEKIRFANHFAGVLQEHEKHLRRFGWKRGNFIAAVQQACRKLQAIPAKQIGPWGRH